MIHEDYICSLGELIDKLIGEDIKCYHFNHEIEAERVKEIPDTDAIAQHLAQSSAANEQRSRLRDAINERVARAVKDGSMATSVTVRTYRKGAK